MQSYISKHKKGIIGAIFFHVALAILLFTFKFHTPLPLPAEQGILINFGTSETGLGKTEPSGEPVEPEITSPPVQQEQAEQGEKQVVTQDFEEAPVLEQETKEKKPEEKEVETTPVEEQTTKEEVTDKKEEEKEPTIDPKALYEGKKDTDQTADGEGVTYGNDNQGSPSGSPDSKNYTQGESKGKGGISFNLSGRNPQHLAKPEYNYQEEGIVVVAVTVNRDGKVVQANPGVKGSTTLNEYLLEMARNAALNSSFDKNPDVPAFQKGTISYHFKMN